MSNRRLILSDYVEQKTVGELIKKIRDINEEDQNREDKEKDFKREPIEFIINSFGGSVYDGLGLVSAIELSKTPIHTICLGSAMSMGFYIFLSGYKRFAHTYSTFMYHELSQSPYGDNEFLKRRVKENERVQTLLDGIVIGKTNIRKEKLDEIKSRREDWFISAEEAKSLGIVDEILQ
jgi:ATP-dependent Clp protease, protease subunit